MWVEHVLTAQNKMAIWTRGVLLVSAPDHTQAKSGLATRAKFLGPDDVSFWNAGIPIKSVTRESHDILSLVPKSGPGTRLSRKMEAKSRSP